MTDAEMTDLVDFLGEEADEEKKVNEERDMKNLVVNAISKNPIEYFRWKETQYNPKNFSTEFNDWLVKRNYELQIHLQKLLDFQNTGRTRFRSNVTEWIRNNDKDTIRSKFYFTIYLAQDPVSFCLWVEDYIYPYYRLVSKRFKELIEKEYVHTMREILYSGSKGKKYFINWMESKYENFKEHMPPKFIGWSQKQYLFIIYALKSENPEQFNYEFVDKIDSLIRDGVKKFPPWLEQRYRSTKDSIEAKDKKELEDMLNEKYPKPNTLKGQMTSEYMFSDDTDPPDDTDHPDEGTKEARLRF